MALLWTHSNRSTSLLCWVPQSWMQHWWASHESGVEGENRLPQSAGEISRRYSKILPSTKMRLTSLQFSGSSLFPFLKIEIVFPFQWNFIGLPWLLKYDRYWLNHFIRQMLQDPQMHLIRSHGLVHVQLPYMFLNLIFSYCR